MELCKRQGKFKKKQEDDMLGHVKKRNEDYVDRMVFKIKILFLLHMTLTDSVRLGLNSFFDFFGVSQFRNATQCLTILIGRPCASQMLETGLKLVLLLGLE